MQRAARHVADGLDPRSAISNDHIGGEVDKFLGEPLRIPTVFVMVGNPVGSGYVASLAHPGGNVTGFSAFEPAIVSKWIQSLKEIAPATKRVTVLFYPDYEFLWRGAEAGGAALGIEVTQATCQSKAEIERALTISQDVEGMHSSSCLLRYLHPIASLLSSWRRRTVCRLYIRFDIMRLLVVSCLMELTRSMFFGARRYTLIVS
jgi:hypothetical protein